MDKGKFRRGAGYVAGAVIGAGTAYAAAKGMGAPTQGGMWSAGANDAAILGLVAGPAVVHAGYEKLRDHAQNTRLGRQFKK